MSTLHYKMDTDQTFAVPVSAFLGKELLSINSYDLKSCDLKSNDIIPNDIIHNDIIHNDVIQSKPIEIICVTITGQQIKITIDTNLKVIDLKKHIYKKTDIMLDDQRIVFGGKQLDDINTLASYNIANGNKVHLVTRLRGGMFHKTSGRADFVSLNFITKFQKGAKMIHGLRSYGLHLDTLDQLEMHLQKCETDSEMDKIYKLIEDVYIN